MTMIVSWKVSPFDTLVLAVSENPMTRPPRWLIALSKLRRVRVEGSKKREAITFPASTWR